MGRVLVLNAAARHGLVAIRSLGRRGLSVTAGCSTRWTAGGASKYADRRVTYPDPETHPGEFVDAVESELRRGDYEMVLPVNQVTVETVAKYAPRFEAHAAVPLLPYEDLCAGLDKARTVAAAREFDVPHPETLLPHEVDLDAVGSTLGYPAVVKPCRGSGRDGVTVCSTREELEAAYRRTRRERGRTLVQEYVPNGGERGVYTFYDRDGALSALTVQRRIRSEHPDGGASTYRETVTDPTAVDCADRLLSSLGWEGVAMAEFRVDPRDGRPKLLEVNPRLWGSLALSVYAGVDFPYLLYRLATGRPVERDLGYEVGVQARCLFTDAIQAVQRPDRLRALREFVSPAGKPCRYDIVSLDDPLPTVGHLGLVFATLVERGVERAPLRSRDEAAARADLDPRVADGSGPTDADRESPPGERPP